MHALRLNSDTERGILKTIGLPPDSPIAVRKSDNCVYGLEYPPGATYIDGEVVPNCDIARTFIERFKPGSSYTLPTPGWQVQIHSLSTEIEVCSDDRL